MIYELKKFRTLGAGECMRSLIKIFELKTKVCDNVWNE